MAEKYRLYKVTSVSTEEVKWHIVKYHGLLGFYMKKEPVVLSSIEEVLKYCVNKKINLFDLQFMWNGDEEMENVVQITRKDNGDISYQGKVIERHDTWCRAIIITPRGNEIWTCNDDFWHIEYEVKVEKFN